MKWGIHIIVFQEYLILIFVQSYIYIPHLPSFSTKMVFTIWLSKEEKKKKDFHHLIFTMNPLDIIILNVINLKVYLMEWHSYEMGLFDFS